MQNLLYFPNFPEKSYKFPEILGFIQILGYNFQFGIDLLT